jgi:hypothetical protein
MFTRSIGELVAMCDERMTTVPPASMSMSFEAVVTSSSVIGHAVPVQCRLSRPPAWSPLPRSSIASGPSMSTSPLRFAPVTFEASIRMLRPSGPTPRASRLIAVPLPAAATEPPLSPSTAPSPRSCSAR